MLAKKARERGWDPSKQESLDLDLVIDKPRSGRSRKVTEEKELQICRQSGNGDRNNLEQSAAAILPICKDVRHPQSTL